MAQAKIKGSTDWPMASNKPNFTSDENGGIPATLVIHEEKHEQVFTTSEVDAYVKDLLKALFDPGAYTERHCETHPKGGHYSYEETMSQWTSRAKAIVRKSHGLSDPA